jgi:hypothetical protein
MNVALELLQRITGRTCTSQGVAEDAAVPDEPADAAANGDEEVDDWESLA